MMKKRNAQKVDLESPASMGESYKSLIQCFEEIQAIANPIEQKYTLLIRARGNQQILKSEFLSLYSEWVKQVSPTS